MTIYEALANAYKECAKCHERKPLTGFHNNRASSDGKGSYCRPCHIEHATAWTKANRDRVKETRRRRYAQMTEPERMKRRGAYDRDKNRWAKVRQFYKLEREDWERLLAEQGGTCALCPTRPEDSARRFSVDHDHSCCPGRQTCGKCIRGLLCSPCNLALHKLIAKPEGIERLRAYLESTP